MIKSNGWLAAALAIVPLAGLIGRATDQVAICAGPRPNGLLNATFRNLTELMVAVLLIAAGNFEIVKASLIGPGVDARGPGAERLLAAAQSSEPP